MARSVGLEKCDLEWHRMYPSCMSYRASCISSVPHRVRPYQALCPSSPMSCTSKEKKKWKTFFSFFNFDSVHFDSWDHCLTLHLLQIYVSVFMCRIYLSEMLIVNNNIFISQLALNYIAQIQVVFSVIFNIFTSKVCKEISPFSSSLTLPAISWVFERTNLLTNGNRSFGLTGSLCRKAGIRLIMTAMAMVSPDPRSEYRNGEMLYSLISPDMSAPSSYTAVVSSKLTCIISH